MSNREQYIIVGATSTNASSPEMLVPVSGAVLTIEGMTSGNVLLQQNLSAGWTTIATYTADTVVKVSIAPGNLIRISWNTVVGTPTITVLPASDNGFAEAATDIAAIEDDIVDLTVIARRLTADATVTFNGATYLNIFPNTLPDINLEAGATYEFEIVCRVTCGTGTASMRLGLDGGTATFTSGNCFLVGRNQAVDAITSTASFGYTDTIDNLQSNASSAAGDRQVMANGMFIVNQAGTFMPQILFSADPTGTILVKTSTYARLTKIPAINQA